MKYKQSEHKIKQVWDKQQEQDVELNNKSNNYKNLFLKGSQFKNSTIIYESDWIPTAPRIQMYDTTDNASALPERIRYEEYKDLKIPDYLIPYVDVTILTKVHDDKEKTKPFIANIEKTTWGHDSQAKFIVDGNRVYEGRLTPSTGEIGGEIYATHSQTDIDSGAKYVKHPKKHWVATIEYTVAGEEYKVYGTVVTASVFQNQSFPKWWYRCYTFKYNHEANSYDKHQIHSMDSSSIAMTCIYLYQPSSEDDIETTDEVTVTKNWSSGSGYYIELKAGYKMKKVGGEWVDQESSSNSVDSNTFNITSKSFTQYEVWACYTDMLRYTINWWKDGTTKEGDSDKYFPSLPDATEVWHSPSEPGDIGSVQILRNPDPYPIAEEDNLWGVQGWKNHCIVKLKQNEYRFKMDGQFFKTAPSNVLESTWEPVSYNDTYTNGLPSVSDWNENINHTLKSRPKYTTSGADISIKYMISLTNPLYYGEIQKHNS